MPRSSATLAALALCGCGALIAATPASKPDPVQLLRDAVNAYSTYSYSGQVQRVDFGRRHGAAVLVGVEHQAPSKTRRWFLAPQSLYGDTIISLGDTSYHIEPREHRIVVVKDDAIDDQVAEDDNFGLLLHNYRAVSGSPQNVAGRPAFSVNLVNRYTGQTVIRIAIDASTKLVLRKERYAANGAVDSAMRFEQISYTKAFPESDFAVPSRGFRRVTGFGHDLPSNDLQSVVRSAGFRARGPSYLPHGFLPVAGDVSDVKGVRTLHLLYSDGLRTVSLFQNARGSAVDMSRFVVHSMKVG